MFPNLDIMNLQTEYICKCKHANGKKKPWFLSVQQADH